jgi:general L-amino acid transport system substrate-binding protein
MFKRFAFISFALTLVLVLSAFPVVFAQETGGLLQQILDRGSLLCGVSGGLPGFANVNPETNLMEGLDADFCRAVAAAIFGPDYSEEKVTFNAVTAEARFTALQAGQVDVLMRNTTWTLTRDLTLSSDFGPTTFYDGQGFLVRIADGYTSLADMEGVTFCSTSGTTTEKNVTDVYRAAFGADPTLILAAGPQENLADFEAGTCDILTSDKSQLAGLRSASSDPASLTLLPDTISKEPLGPMYLSGDAQFADIVNWTVYATFQAEEYGITSENIDSMMESTDVGIQRFLGLTEDNYGTALGIPNSFAADIIRTVGNYAEIYERNIVPIGITREGSLNDLWTRGGLLYAPAWR